MSRQPGETRSPKALEVLRLVRQSNPQPWPLDRYTAARWRLRQRIAEVMTPRPRRTPALAWICSAGLAAAALALVLLPSRVDVETLSAQSDARATPTQPLARSGSSWSEINLPDLGVIEISAGEAFEVRELTSERQIRISAGTLRAHMVRQDPARPAVIATPHLRVVVVGTRFDVRVDARRTTVEVLEGAVRVEALLGDSVIVAGGSGIDSDDPRLRNTATPSAGAPPWTVGAQLAPPPSPVASVATGTRSRSRPVAARAPVAPSCESLSSSEQRACFERVARGSDLAAQNALYTLGIVARDIDGRADRALELFRDYSRRFPIGLLGPEATLGALDLLQRQGRVEEAIGETLDFERRFATDARTPEVTLVRAELLCRDPARRAEGLALIERVERLNPNVAAAAERARSRCEPTALEPEAHDATR